MALFLSSRLIKGDGEVLEEIVSKERHKEINKVTGGLSPSLPAGGWVEGGAQLRGCCTQRRCFCLLGPEWLHQGKTKPWQPCSGPSGWVLVDFCPREGCALRACLSLSSKPPGGTGWPSRCGRGCCSEGLGSSHAGGCSAGSSLGVMSRTLQTAPHQDASRGSFHPLCKLLTGKESTFNGSSPSKPLLSPLSWLWSVWL